MLKIGLTGGIASGKSLVAARFRELGAMVIDADALAREVVERGTSGLAAVVDLFGDTILNGEGSLDRAKLAALVFKDPVLRERLNAIVHPLVRARAAELLKEAGEAGSGSIVVQDIPLLVETGQASSFDVVVVVDAPDDVRVQRMMEERGMSGGEARSRMAAQASRAERLAAADIILDNSGTVESLIRQVDTLWESRLVPLAAATGQAGQAGQLGQSRQGG